MRLATVAKNELTFHGINLLMGGLYICVDISMNFQQFSVQDLGFTSFLYSPFFELDICVDISMNFQQFSVQDLGFTSFLYNPFFELGIALSAVLPMWMNVLDVSSLLHKKQSIIPSHSNLRPALIRL